MDWALMTRATRLVSLMTLTGVVAGGLLGYFFPGEMQSLGFIGNLFVNALRILIIPLIVASIIVGMTALGSALCQ